MPKNSIKRQIAESQTKRGLVRSGKILETIREIENINWDMTINSPLGPQDKVNVFYDTMADIINTSQPLRRSRIRNDKPWMTEELKELIVKRQRLFKTKGEEWRKVANEVKTQVIQKKKAYYNQLSNQKPKELWNEINKLKDTKQDGKIKFSPDELNEGFKNVWKDTTPQLIDDFITTDTEAPNLPGRNTMDALITVIDDWTKAIDVKSTVHAVFFDFQKAFDLVDHTILLNKLRRLKLPTWIISWVAQYLKGRKQRVKIGDKFSAWTDVAAGVIQGSVLGPTLFLLFIYDINEYIDSIIEIIKYADDIVIYNIIKDLSEDKVQDAVNGIAEWARINKMKLNEKKTQHMFINQKMHGPHLLNLNNEPLTETREYTYLGIKINQDMSCGEQWSALHRKLNSNIHLFREMKKFNFDLNHIVNAYKSLSLSVIAYAAPLLTSCTSDMQIQMQRCQKKFLRIIKCTIDEAKLKFNIVPIKEYIDLSCTTILKRMLQDDEHPVTKKLDKANKPKDKKGGSQQIHQSQMVTRAAFKYEASKPNGEKYNNSFIPKTLRAIRDGNDDKYTGIKIVEPIPSKPSTATSTKTQPTTPNTEVHPKLFKCIPCGISWDTNKQLSTHLRFANAHKNKQ